MGGIKVFFALIGFLLLIPSCSSNQANPPFEPDPEMWRLIWSDEFDGDELDLSVWEIMTGTGAAFGLTGWGNYEAQYYHADNITVTDGKLRIEARSQNRSSPGEGSRSFTSGRIRSTGTPGYGDGISVLYGRIEARIKLPVGHGLWPAFWMLPTDSPYGGWPIGGEIDIMEAMGRLPYRSTSAIHFGRHWPNNTYNHSSFEFPEGQSIADFNVYAVEWEPGEMRFYVNEHHFWTQTQWWSRDMDVSGNFSHPAPFDQPFHILLNLAIGGHFDPEGTSGLDPSIFPVAMYVDYVRVYELIGREMNTVRVASELTVSEFLKNPLPNGNKIWNGSFNQESTGLIFWNLNPGQANMGVTSRPHEVSGINISPHVREFYVSNIPNGTKPEDIYLWQSHFMLQNSTSSLSFDVNADATREITVQIIDLDGNIHLNSSVEITSENQTVTLMFDFSGLSEEGTPAILKFLFGGGTAGVRLNNIFLN